MRMSNGSDVLRELQKEPFSLWDDFRTLYTYASYIYNKYMINIEIFRVTGFLDSFHRPVF
jgi:hypothetical protein